MEDNDYESDFSDDSNVEKSPKSDIDERTQLSYHYCRGCVECKQYCTEVQSILLDLEDMFCDVVWHNQKVHPVVLFDYESFFTKDGKINYSIYRIYSICVTNDIKVGIYYAIDDVFDDDEIMKYEYPFIYRKLKNSNINKFSYVRSTRKNLVEFINHSPCNIIYEIKNIYKF